MQYNKYIIQRLCSASQIYIYILICHRITIFVHTISFICSYSKKDTHTQNKEVHSLFLCKGTNVKNTELYIISNRNFLKFSIEKVDFMKT